MPFLTNVGFLYTKSEINPNREELPYELHCIIIHKSGFISFLNGLIQVIDIVCLIPFVQIVNGG